jgi:hypothetical protein
MLIFSFSQLNSPNRPWPLQVEVFIIIHLDTLWAVGHLWTTHRPVAETSTKQHSKKDGHLCPRLDLNRNFRKRSDVDPRLR